MFLGTSARTPEVMLNGRRAAAVVGIGGTERRDLVKRQHLGTRARRRDSVTPRAVDIIVAGVRKICQAERLDAEGGNNFSYGSRLRSGAALRKISTVHAAGP